MTLIDEIERLIQTDDEDRESSSSRMKKIWYQAGNDGRKHINDMFIALCGYGFEALISRVD